MGGEGSELSDEREARRPEAEQSDSGFNRWYNRSNKEKASQPSCMGN
jgi:hypothetical protein